MRGPNSDLISAQRYDEIFTLHGTTMMFLFAVPVMQGMQIYLTPLRVGTRNGLPAADRFLLLDVPRRRALIWVAFVLNIGT